VLFRRWRAAELEPVEAEPAPKGHVSEQALDAVPQGVVLIAANDDVELMNPASLRLIRSASTLNRLAPHQLQSLVKSAREERKTSEREFEVGNPPRMIVATASLLDEGRVLLVLDDVTDRRRLESVRRDFVAAASHELKTPVAAMIASIEALSLALERDATAARRFLSQVDSSARQLADLVSDLLDLSRLEDSSGVEEEVRVDEVVREEAEGFQVRAEVAGIDLVVETTERRTRGSRADLGLAVRNLIDNALRHTSKGGSVKVTVGGGADSVAVNVTDTGDGIPARDLPRIFERFYRVDSARSRSTGGTGLGLAIVRHVVEKHGGRVEAHSVLGEGSTFSIRLPV
jgi:signal transduction histidine kinase